jgi:hypothetical protein
MSRGNLSRFELTGPRLADLISQAVASRGLTLDRVAKEIRKLAADGDAVYCSKQTVSAWIRALVTPGPTYRGLIARWLGLPVATVIRIAEKQEQMRAVRANQLGQGAERMAISTSTAPASMLPIGSHPRTDERHVQDGDEDVDRRDFLRKGVVVAGAEICATYCATGGCGSAPRSFGRMNSRSTR